MTRLERALGILVLALATASASGAQTIVREGDGDVFIDHRIDRLIRTGQYVPVRGSRTIGDGETVENNVLVLGGEVYVEGTITGDLVAVDADVYLRPGSRVGGDVVNVGGGLYRSELSEVEGRIRNLPNLPYEVRGGDDRVLIVSRYHRRALELDPAFGFGHSEYNRVDGLHPRFGFSYTARPVLAGFAPGVRGRIGYRTEPGELTGGGSAFLARDGFTLEGGWMRETFSQDRWIRGDLRNSADFLLDGDDMRNYYGADVVFGEASYRIGNEAAERYVTLGLRYQQEDASSLRAHHPWSILEQDSLRFNPPIDEGTISSFIPFARGEWITQTTATDAMISVEQGSNDLDEDALLPCVVGECVDADGSFTRLRLDTEFAMQAIMDHTLEIELQFMMPVGGDEPLPRQRFGMLGGSSTLRTVDDGAMYGDHLAYSETEYVIPLRFVRLPRNIVPTFELLHMAGLAWTGDRDDDDFVQNVGARLTVWALYARIIVDPAEGEPEITAGLTWPFDEKYPWQE